MSSNKNFKKKHHSKANFNSYVPPYDEGLLAMSVEGLNLSDRTLATLKAGNVLTIKDIVVRTAPEMYRIQNFNKKNLIEVSAKLQTLGVDFRPEAPKPEQTDKANSNGQIAKNGNTNNVSSTQQPNNVNKSNTNNVGKNNSNNNSGKVNRGDNHSSNGNAANISSQNNERKEDNKKLDSKFNQKEKYSQQKADSEHQEQKQNNKQNNNQNNNQKQYKEKENKKNNKNSNSYSSSALFPREPFSPSQPIAMAKDSYTKFSRAGKWGYKDEKGKEVIPPIYDEVFSFKEDVACVEKNNLFGFINRKNDLIIPYKYSCASSFSQGLACVSLSEKSEKCGYITIDDEVVIPFIYEAGTAFQEDGTARAKKEGKWGILGRDGSFSAI